MVGSVSDIANSIFDLPLDWAFDGGRVASKEELEEFSRLCLELSQALLDSELETAIWTLSQARHFVGWTESPDGTPQTLQLDERTRRAISTDLKNKRVPHEIFPTIINRGIHLSVVAKSKNWEARYQALVRAEDGVLQDAGLNQGARKIITDHLVKSRDAITTNILQDRSLPMNKWSGSVAALSRKPAGSLAGPTKRLRTDRRNLLRSKSKVIGLVTMWADALPLLITKDWGITSVWSTIGGATIAAVAPRGLSDY